MTESGQATFSVGGPTPGPGNTFGATPGLTDEGMEGKKPRKSKKDKNWTPGHIEDDAKPRRTIKHKGRLSVRKKGKTLDSNHLGLNEDDHMNDSWESGRDSAHNFDMTN